MSGESFGQMLRRLRQSRPGESTGNRFAERRPCMSQNHLARLAEIDVAYVNRLENGRPTRPGDPPSVPSRAVIHSLATALRCDPLTTDRLLIAAGYWPWPEDDESVERSLAAVHGTFYGRRTG